MSTEARDGAIAPEVAGNRFGNHWWIVFASVLGLSVSFGTINTFAFAEFLKPMSHSRDLGRGTVSTASGVAFAMAAIFSPVFGRLIDRWGVRRMLLLGILLYAAANAALSLVPASPTIFLAMFAVVGIAGVSQTVTPYSKAISSKFDRNRGLALSVALSGVGLGTAFIPALTAGLIVRFGWRLAFDGIGIAITVLAFVPVLLFIPDVERSNTGRGPGAGSVEATGLSSSCAFRSWQFWVLAAAFSLAAIAMFGTIIHFVALLTDRGISVATATADISATGLAIIAGRLCCGACVDRFFGPYVAIGFFACPLLGIVLLWTGDGALVPLIAAILCGFGIGAVQPLMAFLVGRYFGLRAFGTLMGVTYGLTLVGIALGSSMMGWSYQFLGSYEPCDLGFAALLAVACAMFLFLGPYHYGIQRPVAPTAKN